METLAHLMGTDGNRFHVFLGRGGNSNRLRKDSLYRKLLKENCAEYAKLDPKQKRKFALDKVVRMIRERGGRFYKESLQKHPTSKEPLYVEVETHTALRVVMQALRDCLKEQVNEQNLRPCSATPRACGLKRQALAEYYEGSATQEQTPPRQKRKRNHKSQERRVKQEALPAPDEPQDGTGQLLTDHPTSHEDDILRRVQRLEGLVCFLIRENETLKASVTPTPHVSEGSDDEMIGAFAVPRHQRTSI